MQCTSVRARAARGARGGAQGENGHFSASSLRAASRCRDGVTERAARGVPNVRLASDGERDRRVRGRPADADRTPVTAPSSRVGGWMRKRWQKQPEAGAALEIEN
eukprot:gene7684-21684_t